MLRLNRLTVSPRAHQRGHGFRPDGELVAVETTHCSDFEGYWARPDGLTPNPIQNNSGLPKDLPATFGGG
jgi:hypothetical protein